MRLVKLAAERFRRFDSISFDPHSHFSVLRGANASGKTSLLEAIYFGSRAQSFRARRLSEMASMGFDTTAVSLWIEPNAETPSTRWKAEQCGDETLLHCAETAITRRQLASAIPLIAVDRQLHRLIDDGPVYRRRYLDWGLFYVEPSFFELWRRHERVLRQRNKALREKASLQELSAWTPEFTATAQALHALRVSHAAALERAARSWVSKLLRTSHFSLTLSAGWNEQLGLEESLAAGLAGDRKMGFTHAGPSRAELRVKFEERDAKMFVSRGQQKMLAVAMALAQAQLVAEITGNAPILLLDDLEAELAVDWQMRMLQTLLSYPGQSIVTSLEWTDSLLPQSRRGSDFSVFHVEHGGALTASAH